MENVDVCYNNGNNGKNIKDGEMKGITNKGKRDNIKKIKYANTESNILYNNHPLKGILFDIGLCGP